MKLLCLILLSAFCLVFGTGSNGGFSNKRYEKKYQKKNYEEGQEQKIKPPVGGFPYVNPTYGIPWPLPQQIKLGSVNLTASADKLQFSTTYQCDILDQATLRYQKLIFTNNASGGNMDNFGSSAKKTRSPTTDGNTVFTTLQIVVDKPCERYPYLGMNENYTLSVWANGTGLLHAGAIWGALRGLETFSHMFFTLNQSNWLLRTGDISDYPRFAHRGILLDTARHYLSLGAIKKNLDLMAQNKFNVFHWHIVDDQSFPYQSVVFPDLIKGAYSPNHIYTLQNIADVIEYARVRGIRVVAEFDTPGHTESWGVGQPNLLTKCYSQGKPDGTYGPIDPSNPANYDFLTALFTEILNNVFPDRFVHLGGDEVDFTCWSTNPQIQQFMQLQNFGTNYALLENYYIQQLLWLVVRARNDTGYLVWQEVVDNGVQVKPDTVVHVWKGDTPADWGAELAKVTSQNLTSLLSSCWYLNYIAYGVDWYPYYQCDPQNFNGTQEQKDLVLGGEACMWGEYVDDTNLLPRLWPRASPVGERLWSSASLTDVNKAAPRLEEHRCRLLRRGYPVESVNGPGFCPIEWTL